MKRKIEIILVIAMIITLVGFMSLLKFESNRQYQQKYSEYQEECEKHDFQFIAYDIPTRGHYMDCVEIVDGIEVNSYYLTNEGRLAIRK